MTRSRRSATPPPPLDAAGLRALALAYAARYATTRHKLAQYLHRKLRERGWTGEASADPAALAEEFAGLGYVDDAGFAAARAGAMRRRGFGDRRIDAALRNDGIDEATRRRQRDAGMETVLDAALAFARRRRLGPFGPTPPDRDQRRRQISAMLRAGHDHATARRIIDSDQDDFDDPAGN